VLDSSAYESLLGGRRRRALPRTAQVMGEKSLRKGEAASGYRRQRSDGRKEHSREDLAGGGAGLDGKDDADGDDPARSSMMDSVGDAIEDALGELSRVDTAASVWLPNRSANFQYYKARQASGMYAACSCACKPCKPGKPCKRHDIVRASGCCCALFWFCLGDSDVVRLRAAAVKHADRADRQRGGDAVGARVAHRADHPAPAHGAAVPGVLQGAAGAHACPGPPGPVAHPRAAAKPMHLDCLIDITAACTGARSPRQCDVRMQHMSL